MSDVKSVDADDKEHEEESWSINVDEEEMIKKKYGGVLPKKPPLISKDHERAFFDSADWALGKQGAPGDQKAKESAEALQPKLQPTPQEARSRRSGLTPADGEDAGNNSSENSN